MTTGTQRKPKQGTQKASVLQHLQKHGKLAAHDATVLYGVMRLAARIEELRSDGYAIDSHRVKFKDTGRSFVSYRLAKA